jgi:methionyl-tRNA synthetase
MTEKFYITTPIYYPNAEPHLGHFYTTLCTDAVARYHRLCGRDVWFLTGTDWHGIKMVKSAEQAGVSPQELAGRNDQLFLDTWKEFGFSFDDYIRTSEDRHKQSVQEIVRRMVASGDIYLGSYEGWYDEGQEEFITETEAKESEYKSKISGRPLVRYRESTYFFKLTKYVERVYKAIESDEMLVRPIARKNEVLSKLKGWNADLSISRSTLKWGIQMPNDPEHVLYVWIDALSNYITALGYATKDESRFNRYWPADVHLIGKEIMWFHTVYWPAMLMSLGIALPKCVYAHGWWTADGKKMSKSMGNFIDLARLRQTASTYGIDALRYYLLRAAPFGNDLDWNDTDFGKSFSELADVLGNCLNRVINMTGRYREGKVPEPGPLEDIDRTLLDHAARLTQSLASAYANLALQDCATLPLELARAINGYIEATAPFKLAKDPSQATRLNTILNVSAQAMRTALLCLLPILPSKAEEGLKQLNVEISGKTIADLTGAPLPAGHGLGPGKPLFPKVVS